MYLVPLLPYIIDERPILTMLELHSCLDRSDQSHLLLDIPNLLGLSSHNNWTENKMFENRLQYSRVWNKHSPWKNLAKRISVDPFIPYTYTTKTSSVESGLRPLEKNQKINKHRALFIPDSRVVKSAS